MSDTAAGDARGDPAATQQDAELVEVIAAVTEQLAAGRPAAGRPRRPRIGGIASINDMSWVVTSWRFRRSARRPGTLWEDQSWQPARSHPSPPTVTPSARYGAAQQHRAGAQPDRGCDAGRPPGLTPVDVSAASMSRSTSTSE